MNRIPSLVINCAVRSAIALAIASTAAPCFAEPAATSAPAADDAAAYRQRQAEATPASVMSWLREGNRRFVAGHSNHGGFVRDSRPRIHASSEAQRPLAVVLSCIDSRTAPEMAFDVNVGDLFTVRVGANVVNDDVLGSLEIAIATGAKALIVLGHTDCGGVRAACSGLDLGHMTQLLARVKPAFLDLNAILDRDPALSRAVGERIPTNRRYVAEASHLNAKRSFEQIREQSPILRAKIDSGEIIATSALFDVNTGRVEFD